MTLRYVKKNITTIATAKNPIRVTDKAQRALQMVHKWCQANKFNINMDKTKYVIVRHMKVQLGPELKIDQVKINTVHQYEYLGTGSSNRGE